MSSRGDCSFELPVNNSNIMNHYDFKLPYAIGWTRMIQQYLLSSIFKLWPAINLGNLCKELLTCQFMISSVR